jgi:hypothetical protein
MRQYRGLLGVIAVLLVLPFLGCSTANTTSQFSEGYAFGDLGTFRFPSEEAYPSSGGEVPKETMARIRNLLKEVLADKGFQEAPEGQDPDFIVALYGSIKERTERPETNVIGYGMWPGWDDTTGTDSGAMGGQNVVTKWDEGTLIIDVVDAGQLQAVWRGTGSAVVGGNPRTDKEMKQILEKIMKGFPPSGASEQ